MGQPNSVASTPHTPPPDADSGEMAHSLCAHAALSATTELQKQAGRDLRFRCALAYLPRPEMIWTPFTVLFVEPKPSRLRTEQQAAIIGGLKAAGCTNITHRVEGQNWLVRARLAASKAAPHLSGGGANPTADLELWTETRSAAAVHPRAVPREGRLFPGK